MGYNFSGTNAMSRKIIEKHRKEGGKTNTPRVSKEKDPVRAEGEKYRSRRSEHGFCLQSAAYAADSV